MYKMLCISGNAILTVPLSLYQIVTSHVNEPVSDHERIICALEETIIKTM